MKRSFHCPDLSSIGDSVGVVDASRDEYDYYQQPSKRRRADSTVTSCSAVCYCCWEEDRTSCTESSLFLPPVSAMKPSHTSTIHAVTPELAPVEMPSSEELRVVPSFPSLKGLKSSSSCIDECPATVALERFMLPQKSAGRLIDSQDDDDEGEFAHFSFDEQPCDDSHSSPWAKEESEASLSFPRKFDSVVIRSSQEADDGTSRPRSVSFSSRKSSMTSSVSDSSWSSRTIESVHADSSSILSMLSSCTLEPTKKQLSKRSIPTVNEAGVM